MEISPSSIAPTTRAFVCGVQCLILREGNAASGRPAALLLTPGNVADISVAGHLLATIPAPLRLIADKGYDANAFRSRLSDQQIEAVIPSTASRRAPIPHSREAYRQRNKIERAFCSIKDYRRIATRYDELA